MPQVKYFGIRNLHLPDGHVRILLLTVGIVIASFLGRLIFWAHGDVTKFILLSEHHTTATELLDQDVYVHEHRGYDGRIFYRYAIDPFEIDPNAFGMHIPNPRYRMRRMLYPFLVHSLCLGNMKCIPVAMVLFNLVLFILCAMVFYKIAKESLWAPSTILGVLSIIGLWMALSRDTSELLETFCLLSAFYFFKNNKWWIYVLFSCLAVLTRESCIILIGGGWAAALLYTWRTEGRIDRRLLVTILPALIAYMVPPLILYNVFPDQNLPSIAKFLSLPFKGIIDAGILNFGLSVDAPRLGILERICWLLGLMVLISIGYFQQRIRIIKNQAQAWIFGAYLAWTLLFILMTDKIFGEDWGFMRIASSYHCMGLLGVFSAHKNWPKPLIILSGILFVLMICRIWTTS